MIEMTLSSRHRIRNQPWRSEAEHATSRSRRLPTILTFKRGWGRNIFVSFKPPRPGTEPRTLACKAAVLTTTLGPPPCIRCSQYFFCERAEIISFNHLRAKLNNLTFHPLEVASRYHDLHRQVSENKSYLLKPNIFKS